MTEEKIIEAVKSLKMKNCEGSDRLPQRMLVDGWFANTDQLIRGPL